MAQIEEGNHRRLRRGLGRNFRLRLKTLTSASASPRGTHMAVTVKEKKERALLGFACCAGVRERNGLSPIGKGREAVRPFLIFFCSEFCSFLKTVKLK